MSIIFGKFEDICAFFEKTHTPYVLLGPPPFERTNGPEGDVDLAVEDETFKNISALLQQISIKCNIECIQTLYHETTACYAVFSWEAKGETYLIKLDICSDYRQSGQRFINSKELVRGRKKSAGDIFYSPREEINFLYYLQKKIHKGEMAQSHFLFLCEKFTSADLTCLKALLSSMWETAEKEEIVCAFENNSYHGIQRLLTQLTETSKHRIPRITDPRRELIRIAKRIIQPTGLFIAFYGPDGAGKTTAIDIFKRNIAPAFRRRDEFHFRPNLFTKKKAPDSADRPVINPHNIRPRNVVTSTIKLIYYVIDFIAGFFLKVFPGKVCSSLIIFDRYYDDIGVDPLRYRYDGPQFLLKLLRILVPKPDLIFCLDAAPEILQSRKAEVSPAECARQRDEYKAIGSKLPNAHIIDASLPPESVAGHIQQIVTDYLSSRTAERFQRNMKNTPRKRSTWRSGND